MKVLILILFVVLTINHKCIHHQFKDKVKLTPYIDINQIQHRRNLQTESNTTGSLRIYMDFTAIDTKSTAGKNIANLMDISRIFWQNTIELKRLSVLKYPIPPNTSATNVICYDYTIPATIINGAFPNKDYGFMILSSNDSNSGVVAHSYPCVFLQSNNRPIWALISWNVAYFAYDPVSFQTNLYVGIHQMTHCLGFSNILYDLYANGNPSVTVNQSQYLNSSSLQRQIAKQYNCFNSPGMLLENQGSFGTAGTHWSRKVAGNEYITASVLETNPTISYITLALLETTGWYTKINYQNGNFINYGYQKGCGMLDVNNCSTNQFCGTAEQKGCNYDGNAGGHCTNDNYCVTCQYIQYYSNFICTDPGYLSKTVNSAGTGQSQGYNARCYTSSLITSGLPTTKYSIRCYTTTCSKDLTTITITVGNTYAQCNFPGQIISVPGYDGTLNCPINFQNYCNARYCDNYCNSNGVCIKGRCLCSSGYTGNSCGFIASSGTMSVSTHPSVKLGNNYCSYGSRQTIFGDCVACPNSCSICNHIGCLLCEDGSLPDLKGQCKKAN